jgi:hypothetical protein
LVWLELENSYGATVDAEVRVCWHGNEERFRLGPVLAGTSRHGVYLADIRDTVPVRIALLADGKVSDEREFEWRPQRHWEVHLVHYSHHDWGYTDLPSSVMQEFDGFMDRILEWCRETEGWPYESRFRCVVEQAWSLVHYVENRAPEKLRQLARYIRKGQIEVTALYANEITELCGHEEMIRLLYPAFGLRRRWGFEIVSANHNDIPGFSWGLATVLRGAGVRYFAAGIPLWYFGRGDQRVHPLWDRHAVLDLEVPGAVWWEGPDGAKVLFWYDLHGGEWQPGNYNQVLQELPALLEQAAERGYPYDVIRYTVRGGHRDNAPLDIRYAYIAREWNSRWAYPRLINSTNSIFFRQFERQWGGSLKTVRGEAPGTDYPAAATCTPKETGLNRAIHDALLAAETLGTVASIVAGYEFPKATLDDAYRNVMLYDEHCWGMHHPGGLAQDACWSEKASTAYRAAALAEDVVVKASNKITDCLAYPDDGYYVTVFNHLSWERSEIVRVAGRAWDPVSEPMHWRRPQQEGYAPALVAGGAVGRAIVEPPLSLLQQPFEIIDTATGASVPYQLSELKDPQSPEPFAPERVALGKVDRRHVLAVTFLAEGLPPLGYKTYKVVPRRRWPRFPGGGTASRVSLENRYYCVQVDSETGAIVSLYDKELGREVVDQEARHGLGQLIVRACETGTEQSGRVTRVIAGEHGPIFSSVVVKGEASGCPRWTEEIRLYHPVKRVDVSTRVLRDSTPMLELYVAFPFRVENPSFRYESANSVIEPTVDQLPGSNTDYYAVQHWANIGGDGWSIALSPLDTPMLEFGGLWPGYVSGAHHGVTPPGYGHEFVQPGGLQKGHVYALAMYNNFRTNFINRREGEAVFRFSLTSYRGDWRCGRARQFGWGVFNPPLPVWMRGPGSGSLSLTWSFCQVDKPNVMLLTYKLAEDGRGYIVRLVETEGEAVEASVTLPGLAIVRAYETNLVEEDQGLLTHTRDSVRVPLKAFGIATVRVICER